jgi:hypothetical protein
MTSTKKKSIFFDHCYCCVPCGYVHGQLVCILDLFINGHRVNKFFNKKKERRKNVYIDIYAAATLIVYILTSDHSYECYDQCL